jgi:glucose-1-phosphate cytidylyltransferase
VKVGILAGGFGTRLAEETEIRPKPMVEIGAMPILWHIMRHYDHFGLRDFVIALGYKGEYIKRYMVEYCSLASDLTVNMKTGDVATHGAGGLDWNVDLIDTGQDTLTGGRIKRLQPHVNDETFMLTWGDGVSNVDLDKLLEFHRCHGRLVTMTAARPAARFGHIEFEGDRVVKFTEKPQTAEGWINGAFFVCEPGVFDYIEGDQTQWEREPLEALAGDGELMAYRHEGFWACMDTLRDKKMLNDLWDAGQADWKVWED